MEPEELVRHMKKEKVIKWKKAGFQFEPEMFDKLKNLSDREDLSMNHMVRLMIEHYFDCVHYARSNYD